MFPQCPIGLPNDEVSNSSTGRIGTTKDDSSIVAGQIKKSGCKQPDFKTVSIITD
jgi:hypothetical protein